MIIESTSLKEFMEPAVDGNTLNQKACGVLKSNMRFSLSKTFLIQDCAPFKRFGSAMVIPKWFTKFWEAMAWLLELFLCTQVWPLPDER